MRHLSPDQIVDVAEGSADEASAAHAAGCAACRAKADAASAAILAARTDDQPEPSPLLWAHMAARIGEAVRREPAPARPWRTWTWRLVPAAAVAVLVLAAGLALRVPHVPDAVALRPPTVDLQPADEGVDDAGDDPSWLLMSLLSAEVSADDAAASGVLPEPGQTDRALVHLDAGERTELVRILKLELESGRPRQE